MQLREKEKWEKQLKQYLGPYTLKTDKNHKIKYHIEIATYTV